jgi:hypothetical protein
LFGNRNNTVHRLLFLLNAADQPVEFNVPPAGAGLAWVCRFDTAREHAEIRTMDFPSHYSLAANSAALLEC